MGHFLVERYDAGLSAERVLAAAVGTTGPGVVHVVSVFVPGDEGSLCLFEAPDAAVLECAARSAGQPFERIVEVVIVHPGTRRDR